MTDPAPLDAKVVARILRRAGDFERTGVPDEAGTIAEASLIAAAEEVGLSVDAVRRSIAVERLGPVPAARPGDRIVGPAEVYADGELDVPADDALTKIDSWLVDGHHLRRDALRPGHGEWSKRSGLVGVTVRTIRNATGEGKLGDFERVNAAACDTGSGSVVRITIDRTTSRRFAVGGGTVVAVGGMTAVVVGAVAATPIVLVAMPAAIVAGVGVALTGRKRARDAEREIRRVLDAVGAGADPTRLSVDVVRRATGKATTAGSSALRAVGRLAPPPPPPPARLDPPRLRPHGESRRER